MSPFLQAQESAHDLVFDFPLGVDELQSEVRGLLADSEKPDSARIAVLVAFVKAQGGKGMGERLTQKRIPGAIEMDSNTEFLADQETQQLKENPLFSQSRGPSWPPGLRMKH